MLFNLPQVFAALLAAVLIGALDYRVMILGTALICATSALPLALMSNAHAVDGRRTGQRRG